MRMLQRMHACAASTVDFMCASAAAEAAHVTCLLAEPSPADNDGLLMDHAAQHQTASDFRIRFPGSSASEAQDGSLLARPASREAIKGSMGFLSSTVTAASENVIKDAMYSPGCSISFDSNKLLEVGQSSVCCSKVLHG